MEMPLTVSYALHIQQETLPARLGPLRCTVFRHAREYYLIARQWDGWRGHELDMRTRRIPALRGPDRSALDRGVMMMLRMLVHGGLSGKMRLARTTSMMPGIAVGKAEQYPQ